MQTVSDILEDNDEYLIPAKKALAWALEHSPEDAYITAIPKPELVVTFEAIDRNGVKVSEVEGFPIDQDDLVDLVPLAHAFGY